LSRKVFEPLGQLLKDYRRDTKGNFAIAFVGVSAALLAGIGAAVDTAQLTRDHDRAQNVADAAVLSAAATFYADYSKREARLASNMSVDEHMEYGVPQQADYKVSTRQVEPEGGSANVAFETTVKGTTNHHFMGIFGKPKTDWVVTARSEVSAPQAEIMLVVDASASMDSMEGSKINALQASLANFADNLQAYQSPNGHLAVTMIPFSENINFGPDAQAWLNPSSSAEDFANFEGCFIIENDDLPGNISAYDGGRKNGFPLCPPAESEVVLFSQN